MFIANYSSCRVVKNLKFFKGYDYVPLSILFERNTQTQSANEESREVTELSAEEISKEEEIENQRNKSRLPEYVYKVHVQKEVCDPLFKYHFQMKQLRRRYGMYGKASRLNPGIMWPTKDELEDIKEFESTWYPSLQKMQEKVRTENEQKEKLKKDYEKEVEKNLESYPKILNEYHEKIAKKQQVAEELKKKRELLIEEISEYLGYDVDPRDPRFKEAVELREKEKKKALKVKKEKETYAKMLQKLTEIAEKPDK